MAVQIKSILTPFLSVFLAVLVVLAIFGLLLASLWSLGGDGKTFQLITAVTSGSLSYMLGGFILSWIKRSSSLVLPVMFGFTLGFFSFLYLLGKTFIVLPIAVLSAGLAVVGSLMYQLIADQQK